MALPSSAFLVIESECAQGIEELPTLPTKGAGLPSILTILLVRQGESGPGVGIPRPCQLLPFLVQYVKIRRHLTVWSLWCQMR